MLIRYPPAHCTQGSFYNVVTLKMRSRSPKCNHFFKEIVCTQAFYCIKKFHKRAVTLRELAPCPYFFICRYTLLISMCLQKLMNIHQCVFKILGKKQSVTDGHRWTGGWKTWKQYTPPQTKFARGITLYRLLIKNPSHAAIKISINATAAEFICKNIFPTPVQIKKIIKNKIGDIQQIYLYQNVCK